MAVINSSGFRRKASRRYWQKAPLLLMAWAIGSCSQASTPEASGSAASSPVAASGTKAPLVVVTTDVLCDLAKTIAKETIELKCLVAAGVDPHTYSLSPADQQAIETANLILYAGHGFEPSLIKAIKATKNTAPKIAVNELAVPQPLKMAEDGHAHSKEAGHSDDEADPHVWNSAENGIKIVEVLQTTLGKAVPAQAATYTANAQVLTTELTQINNWIRGQIATIPAKSRKLITTHDALGYYAKAYNIPIEGALQGFSTEEKPTPIQLSKLVKEIKASGVPTVFGEATNDSKLLKNIAAESKVKLSEKPLYADGLGEPGSEGETYPKMLVANTRTITEGLGGTFQAFTAK
jgi:manganese/iron transport system substrate-binding protein